MRIDELTRAGQTLEANYKALQTDYHNAHATNRTLQEQITQVTNMVMQANSSVAASAPQDEIVKKKIADLESALHHERSSRSELQALLESASVSRRDSTAEVGKVRA